MDGCDAVIEPVHDRPQRLYCSAAHRTAARRVRRAAAHATGDEQLADTLPWLREPEPAGGPAAPSRRAGCRVAGADPARAISSRRPRIPAPSRLQAPRTLLRNRRTLALVGATAVLLGGYTLAAPPQSVVGTPSAQDRTSGEWAAEAQVTLTSLDAQLDTLDRTERTWEQSPYGAGRTPTEVTLLQRQRDTITRQRTALRSQLDAYASRGKVIDALALADQQLTEMQKVVAELPPPTRRTVDQVAVATSLEEQRDLRARRRDAAAEELKAIDEGVDHARKAPLPQSSSSTEKVSGAVLALARGERPAAPERKGARQPTQVVVGGREGSGDRERDEVGISGPPDPRGPFDETTPRGDDPDHGSGRGPGSHAGDTPSPDAGGTPAPGVRGEPSPGAAEKNNDDRSAAAQRPGLPSVVEKGGEALGGVAPGGATPPTGGKKADTRPSASPRPTAEAKPGPEKRSGVSSAVTKGGEALGGAVSGAADGVASLTGGKKADTKPSTPARPAAPAIPGAAPARPGAAPAPARPGATPARPGATPARPGAAPASVSTDGTSAAKREAAPAPAKPSTPAAAAGAVTRPAGKVGESVGTTADGVGQTVGGVAGGLAGGKTDVRNDPGAAGARPGAGASGDPGRASGPDRSGGSGSGSAAEAKHSGGEVKPSGGEVKPSGGEVKPSGGEATRSGSERSGPASGADRDRAGSSGAGARAGGSDSAGSGPSGTGKTGTSRGDSGGYASEMARPYVEAAMGKNAAAPVLAEVDRQASRQMAGHGGTSGGPESSSRPSGSGRSSSDGGPSSRGSDSGSPSGGSSSGGSDSGSASRDPRSGSRSSDRSDSRDSGSSGSVSRDSGSSGSGSRDSGSHDSGSGGSGSQDSGSHDSGSHDSGSHDSGSHDSGSHDSGSHDSGSHDSGSHDSGSSDSGSHDSGSGDSGSGSHDSGSASGSGNSDSGNPDSG